MFLLYLLNMLLVFTKKIIIATFTLVNRANREVCMSSSETTKPGQVKPEFDPYSHQVHDDPYPYYRALREHDPVYFNEKYGFWLLTKYDDVYQAMRDYQTFSSSKGVALETDMSGTPFPMSLTQDPPDHTRIRKLVTKMMLPKKIKALEPVVRELTISMLQPHQRLGRIDIVDDYAAKLPMAVIARLVGIPAEDEDKVRGWTDDMVYREDGQFEISERVAYGYMNMADYFADLIKKRESSSADSDDILSQLIKAKQEESLSQKEVIGFLMMLGVAGIETTTKLIGNLCHCLWRFPDERQKLITDPTLISNAIEETVRFDGSTQILGRTVMTDIEIRGKKLKAGDRVGVCVVSANRDEDKFEHAEVYNVSRRLRDHIGFGTGIHTCLGAALARLQGKVALEEILLRMPDFNLEEAGLQRTHNPNVRGFTHVPMTFTQNSYGC